MEEPGLQVIDLSKASKPEVRSKVAVDLVNALKTTGFLYIDNIPGFDEQELLKWCQWFFHLPQTTKFKLYRQFWNHDNTNMYRGAFPLQDGGTSYKEGFEIGQENISTCTKTVFGEANVWPEADGDKEFKRFMTDYYDTMLTVGLEIARLLCLGNGINEHLLDSTFVPGTLSTLRLLHYPLRQNIIPDIVREDDLTLCCSEHSDSGFITLLATFQYKGLQLKLDSGKWMDVPVRKNSLVMNIGDTLSLMTGGTLKATRHRVVDPGINRYSVPFFFEPSFEAEVGYILPGFKEQPTCQLEQKPYGDWLLHKIVEFQEYANLSRPTLV